MPLKNWRVDTAEHTSVLTALSPLYLLRVAVASSGRTP